MRFSIKKLVCFFAILSILIFIPNLFFAQTGLEYLKLRDVDKFDILRPYVFEFVSKGYKNVPSAGALSVRVDSYILKNGVGNLPISQFVEDAAIAGGMQK